MLTMAGSKERTNGGTPKDPMLQILRHMPSGGKFHLTVMGANHSDFGGAVEAVVAEVRVAGPNCSNVKFSSL